jgi:hypothetical protein
MKKATKFILLLVAFVALACEKEAGEGGTSSIFGKVYTLNQNGAGETVSEYYALDHDVFIVYGDKDKTYDDKFATSLDGSYEFVGLTPVSTPYSLIQTAMIVQKA